MGQRPGARAVISVATLLTVVVSGCGQLSPTTILPRLTGAGDTDTTSIDTVPTPASVRIQASANAGSGSTSTSSASTGTTGGFGAQSAPARRGSIEETLSLSGRIVGANENDVTYNGTGKVDIILVRPGDTVNAGQVLLQTESKDIEKDLSAARARLETAAMRVEQAQQQARAQQQAQRRDAARRAADDESRRQAAIGDARTNLRRAQDNLDRVRAGASPTEQRSAEAALAAARATLTKATADRDKLARGADPNDVRNTERALAAAQTDADRAQADVDRLTRGADPDLVRSAQREVERAQTAMKVAEATKAGDDAASKAQRDALIANARLTLQDAQDRLDKIKQPADARDVGIAQRNLEVARANVDAARSQLEDLRKGPSDAAVEAASQAVDAAQVVVDNAQDKLDEVNSHPTPAELREAEDRVAQAQAALDRASAPAGSAASGDDGLSLVDLQILQKAVSQEQSNVDTLEQQLADTRLLAPFNGVVTSIKVRAGDTIDPTHPALALAKPGAPIITAEVTSDAVARLKIGQHAHLQIDGVDGPPIDATLADIVTSKTATAGRTAQFNVTWPDAVPPIGRPVQIDVVLQTREAALLVPKKAVRSAGPRQYVQYLVGTSRKIANVDVGIVSGGDAEILSGLNEGQIVVVGP